MGLRERSERAVRRMDGDTSDDACQVMDAAAALDVREFELFRLAYLRWHDAEPLHDRLEGVFARYMFFQEIPPYVRQFAREALARARSGTLDPRAFGVVSRPPAAPDRRGPLLFWGMLALTVGFCGLLIATPGDRVAGGLMCQRGGGMGYVGTVARRFTGKADPFDCRR